MLLQYHGNKKTYNFEGIFVIQNQSTESIDGNYFSLFLALVGILFSGADHVMQFLKRKL